jgi:23S rRNA pseudouridine955/2504/2580 synthase
MSAATDQVRSFAVTDEDDGIRLDRWFRRNLPEISFGQISRWARTGQLRLDGKRATPGDRILAGQSIRVPPQTEEPPEAPAKKKAPERPKLSDEEIEFVRSLVIYEDAAAIVVNKPPGLATQGGTKTNEHLDRLLGGLVPEDAPRPKLVHRLDKDTSGALLVARTPRAAAFFSKSFSSRTARKVYWALVAGVPSIDDGMIDLPLAKQPGTGGEKMHVDEAEGAPARTRYRVIDQAGNRAAWVELQPHTGRTHQLRVHLLAIGHPIVGDGKYGGLDAFLTGSISRKMHLHARRLRIDHPDGGQIDVTAELPDHFAASIAQLGLDPLLADLPLDEVKYSETPEGKRKAAAAAAKSRRKDRKGERRSRRRS